MNKKKVASESTYKECPKCHQLRHILSFRSGSGMGGDGGRKIYVDCNQCRKHNKSGYIDRPKKQSKESFGFIYVINVDKTNIYKIGVTRDINKRISNMKTGNPFDLNITLLYSTDHVYHHENKLHSMFNQHRLRNEWFYLNDDHINKIKNYLE